MRRRWHYLLLLPLFFLSIEIAAQLIYWHAQHFEAPIPQLQELYDNSKVGPVQYSGSHVWNLVPGLPYRVVTKSGRVSRKSTTGQALFDHEYTVSPLGERLTTLSPPSKKGTAEFIGCSSVFGLGSLDNETLPAEFQKRAGMLAHNWGVNGCSPVEAFMRLRSVPSSNRPGHVFYLLDSSQLLRHIGRLNYLGRWGYLRARFHEGAKLDDEFKSWQESSPVLSLWARAMMLTATCQLICPILDAPTVQSELDSLTEVMHLMELQVKRAHPHKQMVVLIWPHTWIAPDIKPRLAKLNIRVLDYSQLNLHELTQGKHYIPIDKHPTAETFKIVADKMVKDLSL